MGANWKSDQSSSLTTSERACLMGVALSCSWAVWVVVAVADMVAVVVSRSGEMAREEEQERSKRAGQGFI